MPLRWSTEMGDWVLNDFGMITPCMKPRDLELLWADAPGDDNNTELYGLDGTLAREVFDDQAVRPITMQLVGDVDHNGDETESDAAGLFSNYRAVCAALHKSTWGGRTCTNVVTCPDGTQLAGPSQVRVGVPGPASGGRVVEFVVTVTIPDGALVPVAP